MRKGRPTDERENKFAIWIGDRVRQARMEANITQEQLAKITYSHLNTIGKIENGRVEPTITTLILIATALDKPITYFLPLPYEHRVTEGNLPDWMREAVIHMKRILKHENQLLAIGLTRTIADIEEKLDKEEELREIEELKKANKL